MRKIVTNTYIFQVFYLDIIIDLMFREGQGRAPPCRANFPRYLETNEPRFDNPFYVPKPNKFEKAVSSSLDLKHFSKEELRVYHLLKKQPRPPTPVSDPAASRPIDLFSQSIFSQPTQPTAFQQGLFNAFGIAEKELSGQRQQRPSSSVLQSGLFASPRQPQQKNNVTFTVRQDGREPTTINTSDSWRMKVHGHEQGDLTVYMTKPGLNVFVHFDHSEYARPEPYPDIRVQAPRGYAPFNLYAPPSQNQYSLPARSQSIFPTGLSQMPNPNPLNFQNPLYSPYQSPPLIHLPPEMPPQLAQSVAPLPQMPAYLPFLFANKDDTLDKQLPQQTPFSYCRQLFTNQPQPITPQGPQLPDSQVRRNSASGSEDKPPSTQSESETIQKTPFQCNHNLKELTEEQAAALNKLSVWGNGVRIDFKDPVDLRGIDLNQQLNLQRDDRFSVGLFANYSYQVRFEQFSLFNTDDSFLEAFMEKHGLTYLTPITNSGFQFYHYVDREIQSGPNEV